MAKARASRPVVKPKPILTAIVIGSLIMAGQHLLASEEESWLRKLGLWPRN